MELPILRTRTLKVLFIPDLRHLTVSKYRPLHSHTVFHLILLHLNSNPYSLLRMLQLRRLHILTSSNKVFQRGHILHRRAYRNSPFGKAVFRLLLVCHSVHRSVDPRLLRIPCLECSTHFLASLLPAYSKVTVSTLHQQVLRHLLRQLHIYQTPWTT